MSSLLKHSFVSAIGGLTLAGLMATSALPAETDPISAQSHEALIPAAKELFARQFTFISDGNHGDIKYLERFVDFIPAFAESGGKHILLERPAVTEDFWQLYKNGTLDNQKAEDFLVKAPFLSSGYLPEKDKKQSDLLFIRIMELAKQHGLEIHAQDQEEALAMTTYPEVAAAIFQTTYTRQTQGSQASEQMWQEFMKSPAFALHHEEFIKKLDEERDQADHNVADILLSRIEQEKVLIFYGADHDDEAGRLGSILGKDNLTIVPLIKSYQEENQMQAIDNLPDGWHYFAHFIEEDQTYKIDRSLIQSCAKSAGAGDIRPCGRSLDGVKFKLQPR